MLDRQHFANLTARTKQWYFLMILCIMALACASCNSATQQTAPPRGGTGQPPHITNTGRLPLTDSAPPPLDVTPTVPVTTPTPLRMPAMAIPLGVPAIAPPTPTPRVLQTTTIDDSITGTGLNQFNYVGSGWRQNANDCRGNPCPYDGSNSWDNTTNDYMTLTFTGIQIKFYGVLDTTHGIGAVSMDGNNETMIDYYAVSRAGDQLMWTSPMMPEGTHTLNLRVTGNKNPSSTDYYVTVDRVDILS